MFGDLFGKMEEKQATLKLKLATIMITAESGGVKATVNANREITAIEIPQPLLDAKDKDQIEDLIIVALNRALKQAAEKEATETQKLMSEMMPSGLGAIGGLGNLFK